MSRRTTTIALLGLMGTGKSTIGRILATRLERSFLDNDVLLTERSNVTASQLQERIGLDGLHRVEGEILTEQLSRPEPVIVNAAASTVEDPVMRRRLHKETFVVWLQADADVLAARVAAGGPRPSITATACPTAREIDSLARMRHDAFAAIADLAIDTTSESSARSAERIIAALAPGPSSDGP